MAYQSALQFGLKKLFVGNRGQMLVISFDGVKFTITGRYVIRDWLPSWMLFKEPNFLYAINPLADDTDLFQLGPDLSSKAPIKRADGTFSWTKQFLDKPTFVSSSKGSRGGVHLEFNADKTRMVETSFFSSKIDIWDISAANGSLRLMKSLSITGNPSPGRKHHRPHQAVLDPTGRFFVVPNLTADTLLIIDAKDDRYEITNIAPVPTGVGPRHVAFLTREGTHYLVMVAEFTNELFLFEAAYVGDTILLTQIQRQSTYGGMHPRETSKVAEVEVARNQRDVYVSNRITGDETDHVAHFAFSRKDGGAARLDYVSRVSSGGLQPRSFCLSSDAEQQFVFVANETGKYGLVALQRDPETGVLDPNPVAKMSNKELDAPGQSGQGPHFVCEI
ncbi:putative isomerase YbhE [Hypoxylon rubiginosum]|uniref:Isomerase YbhE n=1 Tax=Hypoxylon rubiginosum TaxID=110542 RepID=A0ACB9Z5F8_9PEZI|nr:putative isomerase YbhE [Hypoxylon rubiginosum]